MTRYIVDRSPREQGRFLYRCLAHWRDQTDVERRAIGACVAPSYVAMSYPSRAALALELGCPPESQVCIERWADLLRECEARIVGSYAPTDLLYTIFAQVADNEPVALATMLYSPGTRSTPLGSAIGDPDSSLQTLRMFWRFRFPDDLGIDPHTLPEAAVAELGRLCIRQQPELAAMVAADLLSARHARYLLAHGFAEMIGRTSLWGPAVAGMPAALLYNTSARRNRVLARRGFYGRPLYEETGAEPVPRIVNGPALLRNYFDWRRVLAPLVPPDTLEEGVAAAIRYLAHERAELLTTLPCSLPYLAQNDAPLRDAMARLLRTCGLDTRLVATPAAD